MIADRWDAAEAERSIERWGERFGEELALRAYASRLLGAEPDLVLHGGGNTSVKGVARDSAVGDERPVVFVKASGRDLAAVEPGDHPAADLERLRRLAGSTEILDDAVMERVLRSALLDPAAATPSIEAPVHAVVPGRFVDHTHADAILALTNRRGRGAGRARSARRRAERRRGRRSCPTSRRATSSPGRWRRRSRASRRISGAPAPWSGCATAW